MRPLLAAILLPPSSKRLEPIGGPNHFFRRPRWRRRRRRRRNHPLRAPSRLAWHARARLSGFAESICCTGPGSVSLINKYLSINIYLCVYIFIQASRSRTGAQLNGSEAEISPARQTHVSHQNGPSTDRCLVFILLVGDKSAASTFVSKSNRLRAAALEISGDVC